MNKVFKIVWSKSKQCYVVVSEYAKSNGGKKKVLATVLAGLMMAGVAGGLAPQQALAGDDYSNSAINIEPNDLYPAYRNKGVNKNAIAIGGQNNVTGTPGNGRIALGFGNTASKDSSVAIGSSNEAVGGGSTAIGVDAHAGEAVQNGVTIGGSVALGNSVWAVNAAAVAIGTHVNASGTAAGAYSTAMGSKTDATGFESVAIGTLDKATGTQAVVVGAENEATATNATAIGSKNTATQQAATALGTWTNATGLRSTAVGVNAAASGQSSQAMGDHAEATGFGATAVGKAAEAKAQSAGAFGDTANATGVQSLAAGYSTTATNEDSNAIGSRTSSTGKYATAVGTEANASGESGFAAGHKINATGNQSTAVGYHSTASGTASVTLGRDATASATAAYAMGYGASSTNTSAFAIGSTANAGAYGSMAIGKGATTKAQDATSTYSYSGTGGTVGASGYNTETSTIHSGDGTNTATDTYNAGDTLAIGTNATVSEQSNETVAIGKDSSAGKNTHYSTVIGQGAQARQGASDSTVIGHGAYTEARESVAIGRTANVSGTDSVRSTAMGWGARVSNAYDATAIGTGAQTTVSGGVAIGSGADSSRATTDPKSDAYDAAYANGTAIHNRKYNPTVFATGATQGAVSVGNDIEKRQIINVAGGSDDYDAVNVAQLKNVGVIVKGNTGKSDFLVHDGSLKVEGTGRISTVAADDGTKDSKITLSFDDSGLANTSLTNITNDGKKTITGLGTIVKAGDNVTVTSTSDATTGQKTYTVSTTSPVVYTDKDGNKVYLHDDGKFYTSATGGTEVNNSNVIASFKDPSGATTGGTMIVNNVGSAISNHTTPGVTSPTYLDKLDAAAGDTKTQNAAVNVTDLKNTADGLTEKGLKFDANSGGVKTNKLGSTVKVQGEGAKADTEYSGKNVKTIINQDSVGNTTIDVKLDKNLETDTITVTGKDGKDGKIGINGHDGVTTTITVTRDGKPGVDGAPGTTTTRVVYEKPDGSKEEVATLNDGMKYAGDDAQGTDKTKVVKKKLNETLDIIGGADATKLTDGNIGVNNDGNGKLKVQLSKNLKDINTIKNGGTTITLNTTPGGASNTPAVVISGGNLSMDGNKITNVAPGEISSTSTEAVNGSQLYKLKAEERHIRPTNVPTGSTETTQTTGTDAVYKYDASTKKVTLVYNDGNGTAVNDTKAVIDFSDLATGGSGTNTIVESTDGTVKVTDNGTSPDHKYDLAVNSQKVVNNAQLPVTYTKADGTKVYLHNDGNFYDDKAEGQGNLVAKSDVIASMNDGNNSTTAPMRLNNVASSISNQTGATFLDKLDAANTNNPNSAVNVSDLKNTADGLTDKGLKFDANSGGVKTNKLGSTVKVQGAGTKADTNYDGSNIKTFIDQDASGNTTIDVKLDKDLKTETITAAGKDGKDGKIGINGHDGVTTTITVTRDGKPGLDGAPGTTTTRVVYEKPDGGKEEVATLNDGLRFTGNNTSTENKHKLNSLVKVKGEGVTEAEANAFDSAAGNIAVVADGTDTLTIKLNKNVKGLNTVETKTIQLGDPAGNHTTINYAGDRITYTTPDTTPGATPGSTVTHKVANLEDELHIKPGTYTPNAAGKVTLTYVDGNGNDVAGKTAVVDLSSFTPASGMGKWVAKSAAGEGTHSGDTTQDITDSKAVEFQAGKNVTITQTNDGAGNTVIKYGLSDEIEVGKEGAPGAPGKDGKVGVKGADGSAVVINGKDGSIGLNGTNGRDGITIQGKDGAKGLDGTNTTRIVYHDETNNKDHEVATLDDGMKYAGDDAQGTDKTKVVKKKLNETLDIIGGADATKLTDGNIGVNNDGNGKLKVQLSKNLKDINTIKNGGTTITLNTTPGGASNTPAVVISGGNLSMDGNKITNVAPGEISSTSTEAVNGSQLYKLKAEERHIRPTNVPTGSTETTQTTGTDAVYKYDASTKKVTLVYNDGNGTAVNDTKAVIDFSDLATGGSGTNTIVESTDGTVKVTDNGTSPDHKYDLAVNSQKVVNNAQLPVTYTKADGTKVYLHNDGNFYDDKAEGQGNLVAKSDVIASMNDGNNSTTAPMRLNNVASSISNQTGATFLDKLDAANTNNPNSAVNVSDLKNTADGLTDKGLKFDANSGGVKTNKLGSTVKVQGAGTKADTNYDGSNIKTFIDQDASGNTTIDVKLDKDLKTETITAAGKDGKDGKIGINGHDGVTTTITVTRDGKPGLDGAPGTTTTRVVYEKPDGGKEEVATLNDGLRFTGNNTSTENKHKLNSLVKVKGEGVTEAEANAFDSAAGNIAVVADGTDTLTIKLNKNVKGLNTVETKTIQLGDPAGNHTTINYAGDRITYTTPDTTPGATPGSTVTHKVANLEDELHIKPGTYTPNAAGKVTLTYVDGNGNDVAGKTAVVDLSSFTPASGMGKWVAKSAAGEGTHSGDTTQDITDSKAVEFQAGKNVTITQTNDGAGNTVIKYGLSDEIEVGKEGAPGAPGKDGKVGVKGADGSAVVINGKDGSIGLNGTNGRDGITIQGKDGAKGLDGTNTTRIVYHDETNNKDHEVATLDDGMKFAGDDGQTDSSKVISKKLNTVVDIVGGADKTKLTDNNIGVNNVNGKLKVQLSKDLDLTAGGSVKMGDTTVNNGGITIKAPTSGTTTDVHLGSDGLNNGGNKITNVAKGTADTDAVNVSQLKDAKSELKADERHIKPGTYTVDSNGKVTMTYVDGNGDDVANEKAVIEGIAKNDLSNITNDGKNVITNLIDMENGNNTTVSSRKDATGKKIFKVDVDLSATNRKVDTAATGTGSVASGSAAGAAVVNKGTQFVAGDNMVVKRETMSGNDTDQKITYALNPNLQNIKSISSGTTTSNAPRIDFGSNTVTINNGNLSLGGNKITNLAPGTSSTDAVNLSQLEGARTKVTSNDGSVTVTRNENTTTKEITYDLHVAGGNGTPDPTIYNRINKLGDEIQTVGALGAALGALKPIQYDPLEPTQIMAGYGNYRGTSALALGVAHYRNESLMLHAGMSWAGGSSHMMANAGVTWKLGHRDPETAIADRYRRGPISSAYALQQEMAAVKEENQGLKGEVADLKSENAEMKKNIAMLMAKLGM